MPDQIPPPGPERDAEIAKLLGWDHKHEWGIDHSFMAWCGEYLCLWCGKRDTGEDAHPTRCSEPSWSTEPAACDRLVEEMVRRGWRHLTMVIYGGRGPGAIPERFTWSAEFATQAATPCRHAADSRCSAISAAALLALRGGR